MLIFIRVAATLAVMAAMAAGQSSNRAPMVEGIELQVPTLPATVRIAGTLHVAYELHVTNLRAADIVISRLQVLDARTRAPIADYQGDAVVKRFGRPGRRRADGPANAIGAGMRSIAYFWIAVPDGSTPPTSLVHRLDVETTTPTETTRATVAVEGAPTTVSPAAAVGLSPPLRGGPWVAIYDPDMHGGHRRATYTIDGRTRIPGRFAVDWIRVPPDGSIERGTGPHAPDWNGYGSEVLAVADATVVAAMDDMPDARPSVPLEAASGSYVTLDLGQGRFAFYEHLQAGSVMVKPGTRVRTGQVIGRLGSSGSTSSGPHLHFHVADANTPLGAEGLPFVLTSFDQLGAFASIEALGAGERWQPLAQPITRTREYPAANIVVQFR